MTPYQRLKKHSDDWYRGECQLSSEFILGLIIGQGIRLRDNRNTLKEINFSVAKTRLQNCESLVVGLRYLKADGTLAEDHFAFREGEPGIKSYYQGNIVNDYPEYIGTHKLQVLNERNSS